METTTRTERRRQVRYEAARQVLDVRIRLFLGCLTLPLRLAPLGIAALLVIAFSAVPWNMTTGRQGEAFGPWLIALVGGMLTAAVAVLSVSFLAAQAVHALTGVPYLEGVFSTTREFVRVIRDTSHMVGMVGAFMLILAPIAVIGASGSGPSNPRGELPDATKAATVSLIVAVFVLSCALVVWSARAVWTMSERVHPPDRFVIAVLIPTSVTWFGPDIVRATLSRALPAWLPDGLSGYSAERLADEQIANTPSPDSAVVAGLSAIAVMIYLLCREWPLEDARQDDDGLTKMLHRCASAVRTTIRMITEPDHGEAYAAEHPTATSED